MSDELIKALCDIQDEHQIVDIEVVVDEEHGEQTITIIRKCLSDILKIKRRD